MILSEIEIFESHRSAAIELKRREDIAHGSTPIGELEEFDICNRVSALRSCSIDDSNSALPERHAEVRLAAEIVDGVAAALEATNRYSIRVNDRYRIFVRTVSDRPSMSKSSYADWVIGSRGDDVVETADGDDLVYGGAGNAHSTAARPETEVWAETGARRPPGEHASVEMRRTLPITW